MSNNGSSSRKNLDSSFNKDLFDLFGELAEDSPATGEPSGSLSEELDDLFGDDIDPKATYSNFESDFEQSLNYESKAATPQPQPSLDDDNVTSFDDLFGGSQTPAIANNELDFESLSIEDEVDKPVNEAQIESDLDSFFGHNDTLTSIPEDEEMILQDQRKQHSSKDVVSGLESLFASSPTVAAGAELEADFDHYFTHKDTIPPHVGFSSTVPPAVTPPPAPQPAIAFYPAIEDLEHLLGQPKHPAIVNWQSLEALIQTPAQTAVAPRAVAVAAPVAQPKIFPSPEIDDFGDLEALLEQADRSMGGPPTIANPNAQQARNRPQKANAFEQTMRIPVKQLDNLSNLMGELVVNRNSLEQGQEKLRQFLDNLVGQVQSLSDIGGRMQDLYERSLLERSLLASRGQTSDNRAARAFSKQFDIPSSSSSHGGQDYDPLEMDQFTGFHLLSQEMIELIVRVRESSSDIEFLVDDTEQVARNLRQVSTQLQEGLTKSRMIPFAQAADRLVRPVREISMKLHKKASLQIEGREALIDKMILEQLYDPLTHLINNAVTHGIETPDIRLAQGKSAAGIISLKAFVQGNQIVLAIADDGAGIDPDLIIRKALEKNLVTAGQVRHLGQNEIYDFIFHPGFSTKDQADDFSGRGVGMDVVRTALGAIRGTITIDSVLGRGTTFTIRLPLTLNICKALCCLNRHTRIALPMDGVEDMQDYSPSQIEVDGTKKYIRWRDSRLRIHPLNNLLTHHRRIGRSTIYGGVHDPDQIPIVILRSAGTLLALQVDQVIGEQEIVIKQIEGPIPKPAGISGATVLGDGTIMPVADILELVELAAQGRVRTKANTWQDTLSSRPVYETMRTEPMVLIVDDSITVRELLSLSFTKAGYRVEQARDGQEAWDKLRGGLLCDLVFCDIEMPRVDGLELLSRIQKDPELAKIPVAMLTSRGADRHRQMAAQLGASAYFTKPYLEESLLDAAQKMRQGQVLLQGSIRLPNIVPDRLQPQPEFEAADDNSPQPERVEKVATPTVPPSKTHFKALIIDDSVTVRELLAMTFQNAGYLVEKARDGQDALNQMLATPDFDVAFCDIEMPRIDGLELLNRVREHPELAGIPIAMLTSRGAERHRKIAAERGAKGYFTKPYVEDNLLQAAKRLIRGEVLLDENGTVVT